MPIPRLWRSRSNRVVAGVLGGLAEKFGLEPLPMRLLYGVFTVASAGALAVPYLALWYIASTQGPPRPSPRLWRSRSNKLVAGVLGGLAERWGVRPWVVRVPFAAVTVATFGAAGILAYLVLWTITRPMDAPVGDSF